MADFTTERGGPQGSSIQPLAPVMDNSSASALSSLNSIAGAGFEFLGDTLAAKRAEEKERIKLALQAHNDADVANFATKQIKLADAVDSGGMSSLNARMQMRRNLTQAIADNPSLAVDFGKAHTALIKSTGLGEAVYEGTEEEQQQTRLENSAIDAGWARPTDSSEKKTKAAYAMQDFNRAQDMLKAAQQRVSYQSAQVGLVTAGINQRKAALSLQEAQERKTAQYAISNGAQAFQVKLGNDLEDVRERLQRGEIDEATAKMEMDRAYLVVDSTIKQAGGGAGSDYLANATSPLKFMYDNYVENISGKTTLEALNNKNQIAVAQSQALLLQDPQAQKVAALGIFRNIDATTLIDANSLSMKFLQTNTDPNTKPANPIVDTPEDQRDFGTYINGVTQAMGKVNNGSASNLEATKSELDTNFINILNGVSAYGASASTPAEFKGVLKFLADPVVNKYAASSGGVPAEAAYKAKQTLQAEYERNVLPLLKEEYLRANTGGKANITYEGRTEVPGVKGQSPATTLIKPKFIGSGVIFEAPVGEKNAFTLAKVKDLNKKLAPVLNNLIRASATLEGTSNYKSIYESQYSDLFEEGGSEEVQDAAPNYGKRADGTEKARGYFGELKLPDGNVATEYSVGVEMDGNETEIPTLVPTLSESELNMMVKDIIPNGKQVPKAILDKAVKYAVGRKKEGKSPFASNEESPK